jgi:lipoprotein NlpD
VIALVADARRRPAPVIDRLPPPAAKPAAPSAAPSPQTETYVVKRGDTLYSIALDQGVDWRELAALNQPPTTRLRVGQSLIVRSPTAVPDGPVVESGDAVAPIMGRLQGERRRVPRRRPAHRPSPWPQRAASGPSRRDCAYPIRTRT